MRVQSAIILFAVGCRSVAQSFVGTPYGFATGVTGGGAVTAVTPSSADELASLLSDDESRVILIDKEYDFTGTSTTGAGCDRKSCSASSGGQYYLGDLSCGGSDNVAVSSITYDAAGTEPLKVGSNKTILGVSGAGVIKGKGIQLQSGASNIIIQGIHITDINPAVVWGGDALDFQGSNDGVWVDHCKFSLTGRMFVVSHYTGSRITLSNNEFDGVTNTSASCNGDHYWGLMFIADGDRVTLDRNYFHDQSGRAPKLGADGVSGTFHATNNYFSNMKGHAFDAYDGTMALIEGNVFEAVDQPTTESAAGVSTLYTVPDSSASSACESALGRACPVNTVDSSSGELAALSSSGVLSTMAKSADYLVTPVEASKVAALVKANAGPANLGASNSSSSSAGETKEDVATPSASATPATPTASGATAAASTTSETTPPSTTSATATPVGSSSESGTVAMYGQCGGQGYTGATECVSGTSCVEMNEWYSQCVPSSAKFRREFALSR